MTERLSFFRGLTPQPIGNCWAGCCEKKEESQTAPDSFFFLAGVGVGWGEGVGGGVCATCHVEF